MKLGKCPICSKGLSIYKSLDIYDFERWDYKCNTVGCMINLIEWNYEPKEILIKTYKKSIELASNENRKKVPVKAKKKKVKAKKEPAKKKGKVLSIHYSKDGLLSSVECSSLKTAKVCTSKKVDVTCSRCKRVI